MPKIKPTDLNDPLRRSLSAKSRARQKRLWDCPRLDVGHSRNDLRPNLELVERPIEALVMPDRTIRQTVAAHVNAIAITMRRLGVIDPILIDENNCILDGVARTLAAKSLGLGTVPCIRAVHLTDAEKRAVRLAVNRLGERGTWSMAELKAELIELVKHDIEVEQTGFTVAEFDHIVLDEMDEGIEPGSLHPEKGTPAVARTGEVFVLGSHRIACADARHPESYADLWQGEQAQLIFTDEPYNVPIVGNVTKGNHREFAMATGEMSDTEFLAFNKDWMAAALAFLDDGGLFGTFIDWRGYPTVHAAACELGLTPINLVVWAKTNAGMGSLYRSQHELFPLFKKGNAPHVNNIELGRNGRSRSNVWTYPGAASLASESRKGLQFHPTVKPTSMCEDALLDVTNRGDTILDPFLGSGSTLIAAERTGRRCFGLEIDPLYVDVIVKRYQDIYARPALLEKTGQTYEALSRERLPDH